MCDAGAPAPQNLTWMPKAIGIDQRALRSLMPPSPVPARSSIWVRPLVRRNPIWALKSTKVVAIGGLILGGLAAVVGNGGALFAGPTIQQPTLGASAIALVIVTYCYLGWNVAGYIAGDMVDPRRTLPKIMIGGTAFVAAIYLLLNVVYLSALSITELAGEPFVPVAEKAAAALWGPKSGRLVAAILCLSIAGAVSAMTWTGPASIGPWRATV